MAGKSVAQKLLIRDGYDVLLVEPPIGYSSILQSECPGASVREKGDGAADLIQLFVSRDAELRQKLAPLKQLLRPKGMLWITYPKGSSKSGADLNRDTIREYAETVGLQTVSLIAVD